MNISLPNHTIQPATPDLDDDVELLLDEAFGLGRRTKTSYRFREREQPVDGLSFVAFGPCGRLIGAISYWHLKIGAGGVPALLLGPLAVKPALQKCGIGLALMQHSLAEAEARGHGLVVLVGDEPYYRRAGFSRVEPGRLILPGPVDPARLLYRELLPGAFSMARGLVLPPKRFSGLRGTKSH